MATKGGLMPLVKSRIPVFGSEWTHPIQGDNEEPIFGPEIVKCPLDCEKMREEGGDPEKSEKNPRDVHSRCSDNHEVRIFLRRKRERGNRVFSEADDVRAQPQCCHERWL